MKTKDYILIAIFIILIIVGILLGGFSGGMITGAASILVITVTVGKILFTKSQKRIDAALRMKRMMQD